VSKGEQSIYILINISLARYCVCVLISLCPQVPFFLSFLLTLLSAVWKFQFSYRKFPLPFHSMSVFIPYILYIVLLKVSMLYRHFNFLTFSYICLCIFTLPQCRVLVKWLTLQWPIKKAAVVLDELEIKTDSSRK